MTQQPPKIDTRNYDDIVKQTETLLQAFTDWQPSDTKLDAGGALVRIFARMMEVALDRLNRISDRNFLAFLDLIGTQMLPPQPARVPITFQLAAGSPRDAFVPAKTRIAATPMPGEESDVIFEVDRDLFVTPVRLAAVLVRDPQTGRYGEYTQDAITENGNSFPAMAGDRNIPHYLYLASNEVFLLPSAKTVTISIVSNDAERFHALPISWQYWNEEIWQNFDADNITKTLENSNIWQVQIQNFPAVSTTEIDSIAAAWIRAQLDIPLPKNEYNVPEIQRENVPINATFSGFQPLDITEAFYPFGSSHPPQEFFLNVEEAFIKPTAIATFNISLNQVGIASSNLELEFAYWNDTGWQPISPSDIEDSTTTFTENGNIIFPVPIEWRRREIQGKLGHWLRIRVDSGTYTQFPEIANMVVAYTWRVPIIDRIQLAYEITADSEFPEMGFVNLVAVDFTKAFYPFGEQPRFNDAFYFSLNSEYAQPNFQVTIDVIPNNPIDFPPNPSQDLELVWEVSNGDTWEPLEISILNETTNSSNAAVLVFTKTENQPITVSFTLPENMGPRRENGEEKYWVRIRIARGNYGTEPADNILRHYTILRENVIPESNELPVRNLRGFVPGDSIKIAAGSDIEEIREIRDIQGVGEPVMILSTPVANEHPTNTGVWLLSSAVIRPPSIKSWKVRYAAPATSVNLSICKTENDFQYQDCTAASQTENQTFAPFLPTQENHASLYLGFDLPLDKVRGQPFQNQLTTLYFRVQPIPYDRLLGRGLQNRQNPARLVWEYRNFSDWKPLGVLDETETFSERGTVRFVGPSDIASTKDFGQSYYWLRVRWQDGEFVFLPQLERILTNTIWATQGISIDREILGSSSGEPNQTFPTSKSPVLMGQILEVEEPEMPSVAEVETIIREEGEDAIAPVFDSGGNIRSMWVRWHQVPDFYSSSPRDRHYVLDYLTGIVRFGDGLSGAIPPQRRNSIRLSYRTGGGEIGNRPVQTIVQLKSAIPYIDSATNYEAASGGTDRETLDRVRERGPKFLRHRDRAVTAEDFEDLAREASPNVARSKAIMATDRDNAGSIGLLLVPRSSDPQPIPTLDLIDRVEEYLNRRRSPGVDLWIAGPDWVKVEVSADIVPVSLEASISLDVRVAAAIARFLHPLTGGMDGRGWQFGRQPHASDLYRTIEAIEGVDRVVFLNVAEDPPSDTIAGDRFLIYSGTHQISLISPANPSFT